MLEEAKVSPVFQTMTIDREKLNITCSKFNRIQKKNNQSSKLKVRGLHCEHSSPALELWLKLESLTTRGQAPVVTTVAPSLQKAAWTQADSKTAGISIPKRPIFCLPCNSIRKLKSRSPERTYQSETHSSPVLEVLEVRAHFSCIHSDNSLPNLPIQPHGGK